MSEWYIYEPEKWKFIHIPFTPYFLAKSPEDGLWHIAEKELSDHSWSPPYSYRLL